MPTFTYLGQLGLFLANELRTDRSWILDRYAERVAAVPGILHFALALRDDDGGRRFRLHVFTPLEGERREALAREFESVIRDSLSLDIEDDDVDAYAFEYVFHSRAVPASPGAALPPGSFGYSYVVNVIVGQRGDIEDERERGATGELGLPVGRRLGAAGFRFDRKLELSTAERRDQETIAYVTNLARIAALYLAIYRNEKDLFDLRGRQLETAGQVQRGLLPEGPPAAFPLEVAGYSAPTLDVGGDYFDYVRFRDGSAGILIADVSGKGIPAALLMAMLRGLVRSNVGRFASAARFTGFLNDALAGEIDSYSFVTFACLRYRADGRLEIANAGHNPTLVWKAAAGKLVERPPANLPIGIVKGVRFTASRLRLAPGDRILLYTDGLAEATDDAGGFFGAERTAEIFRAAAARGLAPREILALLRRALDAHLGARPLRDDATLVVAGLPAAPPAAGGPESEAA